MMDQLENLLSNCRGIICLHGGRMYDYGGILLLSSMFISKRGREKFLRVIIR